MLNTLHSLSEYIVLSGASQGSIRIPEVYGSGQVRYHSNVLQVWDGNCWQSLSTSYADITLSDSATSAIKWAQNKMNEEIALEALSKENPAVKIALDKFKQAEEQLKTTIILSKDDQTTS